MKTPKAIKVIQQYQRHIATQNKAIHNRVDMPDAVELDKALSKAVEVMELMEKFNIREKCKSEFIPVDVPIPRFRYPINPDGR